MKGSKRSATLHDLVRHNDLHEIAARLAVPELNVDTVNQDGLTALHVACQEGRRPAAEQLLAGGADIHARTRHEQTPLHVAACEGHGEVARILIAAGADVNARDRDGRTAMWFAVSNLDQCLTDDLLSIGADVNAAAGDGEAPLHIAAANGERRSRIGETAHQARRRPART
jgi:ankyrin repeat protein